MTKFRLTVLVATILASFQIQQASGLAPFKVAFGKKYTDKNKNEVFYKTVRKAGCNVCHVKGEEKTERNAYGEELAKLIQGDAKERLGEAADDQKNEVKEQLLKELDAAFDTVAKMKNKDDETYGERIQEGQLPVPLPAKGGEDQDDDDDKDDDDKDDE